MCCKQRQVQISQLHYEKKTIFKLRLSLTSVDTKSNKQKESNSRKLNCEVTVIDFAIQESSTCSLTIQSFKDNDSQEKSKF